MQRSWKPIVAGILNIVAGVIPLVLALPMAVLADEPPVIEIPPAELITPTWIYGLIAVGIVLAVIAIIGGIMALKRRKWGLALAGSICALFAFPVGTALGIAAIILLIISRKEFNSIKA